MARKFLTDLFSEEEANVIVFGVPLGRNSEEALERIRESSWFVESFDVDRKKNLIESVKTFDMGNLEINDLRDITKHTKEILERSKIPLIMGGGHLLSLYSALPLGENAKLIVFDAHSDLHDSYSDEKLTNLYGQWFDSKFNGATWLRRYCQMVSPKNICIIGLRSCDEDIMKFIEENEIMYFTPSQIRNDIENVKERLGEFTKGSALYISVDMDVFDPSIAPVEDYPEPDGLSFEHFKQLADSFDGVILCFDIVELQAVKNSEAFEFLTVKVIIELLGLLSRQAGVP